MEPVVTAGAEPLAVIAERGRCRLRALEIAGPQRSHRCRRVGPVSVSVTGHGNPALIVVAPVPGVIDPRPFIVVVTFRLPLSPLATRFWARELTVSAAVPDSVSVWPEPFALASLTVMAPPPLSTIVVLPLPVVTDCGPEPAALPVIVAAPETTTLPVRLLTVFVAEPASVNVLVPTRVASTAQGRAALSVIVVGPEPVAMVCAVVPVAVMVNIPLSPIANRLPVRPVTVSAAEPASVRVLPAGSTVALTASAPELVSVTLVFPFLRSAS